MDDQTQDIYRQYTAVSINAFDRGLIAIHPDTYQVMVSSRLSEPVTSPYSIRQFEGQTINRPDHKTCWPKQENLAAHLARYEGNF